MDGIELSIPATEEHLMVVRLATAGAATLTGYNVDDIEDIKSAVCEACYFLMNQPCTFTRISVRFSGPGFNVRIRGEGERVSNVTDAPDHEVARIVLSSMIALRTFEGDDQGISLIEMYKA